MRILLIFCFVCYSGIVFPQAFLNKISVQIDKHSIGAESMEFAELSAKVLPAYQEAMKSLAVKHAIKFVELPTESGKGTDLVMKIRLAYNDKTSMSYGALFRYKTETSFITTMTDSVVARVEIIYKDLAHISQEALIADTYAIFNKTLIKIAVPVETLAIPVPPKEGTKCLCLKIDNVVKSKTKTNNVISHTLTNILNNAIVFRQQEYAIQYFDNYKTENKSKAIPHCHIIKGILTATPDTYMLELFYDGSLNLESPKKVKTKFFLPRKTIDQGYYYQAVWQLNKSIYDLMENNTSVF